MDFHIQTPDGVNQDVVFPGNLPVQQLLGEFITDENIKVHPREVPAWDLQDDVSGQKLDLKKSLEQNGIRNGHRLRLVKGTLEDTSGTSQSGGKGLKRCENGHFWDPAKFMRCPFDGVQSIEFGGSRSIRVGSSRGEGHTLPARAGSVTDTDAGDQPTRRIGQGGIDPVVGWLVCVHGKNAGRDYRIRSENNTVGRSESMDICISGDDLISRERHTVITFDPLRNSFHLSPAEGRSLVYLNGEALLAHKELKPYDEILLGATKLLFVPFCGDKFKWS